MANDDEEVKSEVIADPASRGPTEGDPSSSLGVVAALHTSHDPDGRPEDGPRRETAQEPAPDVDDVGRETDPAGAPTRAELRREIRRLRHVEDLARHLEAELDEARRTAARATAKMEAAVRAERATEAERRLLETQVDQFWVRISDIEIAARKRAEASAQRERQAKARVAEIRRSESYRLGHAIVRRVRRPAQRARTITRRLRRLFGR